MKGPRELKRLVAKHHNTLKAIHWDYPWVFRNLQGRCKKWYKRQQFKKVSNWQ